MKAIIEGIEIDVRSNKSLYITIGDYTYYIDDSTNEQIMEKWMPEHIKDRNFIRALRIGYLDGDDLCTDAEGFDAIPISKKVLDGEYEFKSDVVEWKIIKGDK